MSTYLNTRISLQKGRLWRPQDYLALLDADDAELATTLADRGLATLAVGYTDNDPRSLEARIIAQLLEETLVLSRPLLGEEREFVTYWTERFEVSNVKTLLRGKLAGEPASALMLRLTPMGLFAQLNLQELAHTEDLAELLRTLEAGPYAQIVRQARHAFEQSRDLFTLDAALDRGYFEGLAHRAQAIESRAGEPFRKLMASLIDRTNLVWLLRYRFNYGLPPAQVYYMLVAAHYSLTPERLRQLATLENVQDVMAALPPRMRELLVDADDIPGISAQLDVEAANTAYAVLHSNAPAIARAFAYLILREQDLRKVRAVLRGRHLGLAQDDILLAMRFSHAEEV